MKYFARWIAVPITLPITILLLNLISSSMALAQAGEPLNDKTLEKAVDWLVAQQDESGAFKSKHYGSMKQGAAITSLVLYSLATTPNEYRVKHGDAIEKAFQFLETGTKTRRHLANPDGSLDHPVYGTALFLVAAKRFERKLNRALVNDLLRYLVACQCAEDRGFDAKNPNYGGWDVIGPDVMAGKTSGANVSVTRFVLEAFDDWRTDSVTDETTTSMIDKSRDKAKTWIRQLQKSSTGGGFHFTTQPGSALNKSKSKDGTPKSYATATCDGFLVYVLLGEDNWHSEHPFNTGWIEKNVEATQVFGFSEDDPSGWSQALHYYHLQIVSKVANPLRHDKLLPNEWSTKVNTDITALLNAAQKEDGRFENESALMRENDPLIATSFAIIALGSRAQREATP